jgi:hypothetical protein
MADKSEIPPIWMERRGVGLVPCMQLDADEIAKFPFGEKIKVKLHTGRVPKRLRFYRSFLSKVVAATECAPNADALHEAVKLNCGYVTPVLIKGYQVNVPRSVAFDKMTEVEFSSFLKDALRFIAESYGLTPEMVFNEERMG